MLPILLNKVVAHTDTAAHSSLIKQYYISSCAVTDIFVQQLHQGYSNYSGAITDLFIFLLPNIRLYLLCLLPETAVFPVNIYMCLLLLHW